MVVFTHVSTFPNRKVKSGVGKIAEEEPVPKSLGHPIVLYATVYKTRGEYKQNEYQE